MDDGNLILVGWNRSPFTRRVAVSLNFYGIPYEQRHQTAWGHFDEIKAVTPTVKIPVLILGDGSFIPESAAILDYLDCRVGPDRALVPPPSPLRDRVRRIVALVMAVMDKGRELAYEIHLRPQDLRHEPWVERWSNQITGSLSALEAMVETPFAAGERFTQADVSLGVMYDMIRNIHPELLPVGAYPALDAKADQYHGMAEFQAAALEED